jgi:hypothetical protein
MTKTQNQAAPAQTARPGWSVSQLARLQELTGQAQTEGGGDLLEQIKQLRASIPPELLRPFDASMEHGRAAAALVSESGCCERCHLSLPSGIAARVRLLNDQIYRCPYCGCYLYSSPVTTSSEISAPATSARRPGRGVQTFRPGSPRPPKAGVRALASVSSLGVPSKRAPVYYENPVAQSWSGKFLKSGENWTTDPKLATDFQSIHEALEFVRERGLKHMEVVLKESPAGVSRASLTEQLVERSQRVK